MCLCWSPWEWLISCNEKIGKNWNATYLLLKYLCSLRCLLILLIFCTGLNIKTSTVSFMDTTFNANIFRPSKYSAIYFSIAEQKYMYVCTRGADKSLARPGRKQARMHVRNARNFNNIETRAVIRVFFFLQGKAPKETQAILTKTLGCFRPGRAKDLSAPLNVKLPYSLSDFNRSWNVPTNSIGNFQCQIC